MGQVPVTSQRTGSQHEGGASAGLHPLLATHNNQPDCTFLLVLKITVSAMGIPQRCHPCAVPRVSHSWLLLAVDIYLCDGGLMQPLLRDWVCYMPHYISMSATWWSHNSFVKTEERMSQIHQFSCTNELPVQSTHLLVTGINAIL